MIRPNAQKNPPDILGIKMMIDRCKYFLPLFYYVILLSCFVSRSEGNSLSAIGFYRSPDEIILTLDNADAGYREHFLLGLAHRSKSESKDAIFHFANSCFKYKKNPDLRLFPSPVYEFVNGFHIKSEYYNDSVYEIARAFFDCQEYEYAAKFTDLMSDAEKALYRDGIILKSKALLALNRYSESLSALSDIYGMYDDTGSKSDILMRVASVYEKQEDPGRSIEEYLKIVRIDNRSWQSGAAAARILQLINKYEYKFKEADILMLITALYNSSKYNEALGLVGPLLEKNPAREIASSASEYRIRLMIRTGRDKEAEDLIGSCKDPADNAGYRMVMADELWSTNRRERAVKIYGDLTDKIKEPSLNAVLKRMALYNLRERIPGFEREIGTYLNKYPGDASAEYFSWILARELIGRGDFIGALGYLEKASASFPNGIYSGQIRYWLYRLYLQLNRPEDARRIAADLTVKNPDSYYMWNALMGMKDNYKIGDLYMSFEKAVDSHDARLALFYNALILVSDGDFKKRDMRLDKMKSFSRAEMYTDIDESIKDLEVDSKYDDILGGIEKYFAVGYTGGINRETALIPDIPDYQRSKYIAFSNYGSRYGSYFYALIGTLKLVNRRPMAENVALLPLDIIKKLYPDAFADEVEKRCKESGIEKNFVLSVIRAESSFNHQAVSPAGAVGLMQIMPSTGRGIAKELDIKDFDLADPLTSIFFGVRYVAWLKRIFDNDFDDIVAGYNAGAGNVKKWKKDISTEDRDFYIENIPFDETRYYILRTRKNYYIYNLLQPGRAAGN